jgi:nitroreductase
MRRLKPDPVPLELIRKLIDSGIRATNAMNTQPWEFVVVRDRDAKRFLRDQYAQAIAGRFGKAQIPADADAAQARDGRALQWQVEHLHEVPAVILCCGLRDWPFAVPPERRVGHAPPSYGSLYPCVQNMLLACRALGLGATLTTLHQLFEQELHEYFAIPEEYGVVVMMPIGYPLGSFGPVRRKPAESKTHFDRWGRREPS